MGRFSGILKVLVVLVFCFGFAAEGVELKTLIVDGQNNHKWQKDTPVLKDILEESGLFEVSVATAPAKGESLEGFAPDFGSYDVVVSNYNGAEWPESTKQSFVEYVRDGGGLVIVHAADNSFPEWKEYNEMIGLGGWKGRDEKSGPYVYWKDGHFVTDNSPGKGGTHGKQHAFQVIHRDKEHPITVGLSPKWMHAKDELYSLMRGPAKRMTVLATAWHDVEQGGTGRDEPVLFIIRYGKGRVFHTVLGHNEHSMNCVGFAVTLQRGTEWAATGDVTQKVPDAFPGADEVLMRPRALEDVLKDILIYRQGQSRAALSELDKIIGSAQKSPEKLKAIEKRLAEFLGKPATPAAKQFICRKLSVIGSKDSVGALANLLTQPATSEIKPSDMARYALERIPGPAASGALLDGLDKTTGSAKIGIINSLGARRDKGAVKKLSALVSSKDEQIARASIIALGRIADRNAAEVLRKAQRKISRRLQPDWADSYLSCADQLVVAGNKRLAIQIYRRLYDPKLPVVIRAAALRGMIQLMSIGREKIIVEVLKSDDRVMQAAAIGLLKEIDGQEIVKAITAEFPNLSASAQVQVLAALSRRNDKSAIPAVLNALKSYEPEVRIGALGALGSLGDADAVKVLSETAAKTTGAEQQAARQGLYSLKAENTDQMILDSIASVEPAVKIELIRSIAQRDIADGTGALFGTLKDSDSQVRLESWKTLRLVGKSEDIKKLLGNLSTTQTEIERSEAEITIAAVARKIKEPKSRSGEILAALSSANDVSVRSSLLRVLGKIGGTDAYKALQGALSDSDEQVRTAAVRALADWPSTEPMDDLLAIAEKSDNKRHRILALRGYIRMIGIDNKRSAKEKVGLYVKAMKLSTETAEQRMVLSGLASVRDISALAVAVGYMNNENLTQETASALLQIASGIYGDYPLHSKAAIEQVIKVSKSESVRKQAQDILESYEKFSDYITDWEVSGPYIQPDDNQQDLIDISFEPEQGSGSWAAMPSHTDSGRPWALELDKAIGGSDRVGYLRTNVWSPQSQKALLYVGSNDGIKVLLNGEVVHSNNTGRTITRDEDKVEVELKQGWNLLLMKITQSGGKWAACARVSSVEDKAIWGLKVSSGKIEEPVGQIELIGSDFSSWSDKRGEWVVAGNVYADPKKNYKRLAWDAGTGAIVNGNGEIDGKEGSTVNLYSKAEFGDVKAHVEFMVPRKSNSGVYFMGRYEVQVLDSWGIAEPGFGDCGGIYQRWDGNRDPQGFEGHGPRVNASLPPGVWQSFDVVFRAPRFDSDGKKIANARFDKVAHNGVVVHENVEVTGPTRAAGFKDEKPTGQLMLQGDHGPVAYRNITIIPLKDR
ncbi:MAG: HEAT repeat domain-containing protein [Planctomycetota bacterium]|jgi:HEAT repeat protein/type 1 glutamine amidotransferase